ncbi:peptidase family M49-domain-containing protein [Xylariaceae sp. FL0662B]|nr:peptidase family M49-domain-containing protein [Xylariaceae sp. FL0662B]
MGGVQVYKLGIGPLFDQLPLRDKKYCHYLSRAAWCGARIILRQVSPESLAIFDFIIELYGCCEGDWKSLREDNGLPENELQNFLEYAATFLSNIGNYYGSGDQKFVPKVNTETLEKLSSKNAKLRSLYDEIKESISSVPPYSLGIPSDTAQSSYYTGAPISRDEIALVSKFLEENSVFPENTRIQKVDEKAYNVLQASIDRVDKPQSLTGSDASINVQLVGGDHGAELVRICDHLVEVAEYASSDTQRKFLGQFIESFRTGSLDTYRDSQRTWISDKAPRVENIFGFVEPYRDPFGIRAEFEGLVAISDPDETKLLSKLVSHSDKFIRRLPWVSSENSDKGPFEKSLFEPPDFSSIHALAYCSSIIFPGINLPNYNDIRQDEGFKNVIIANRMTAESTAVQWPFIDENDMETFRKHKYPAYYWWVVLHELLGHGTGRLMMEETAGNYNFDINNRPIDPLSNKPINSWYRPGQTWTGQFGDLATTVDECRAELVGAYLMDDAELLELFGFTEQTEIKASDLTYNLYQQLGVDGLRGLSNFNVNDMKWGQAHSRAHFAMLTCLLREGNGCVKVRHDHAAKEIKVYVDRSKIRTYGKQALGHMLHRLHMYRCTADVQACREYYESLTQIDEERLSWRETVMANKPPPLLNVQANTFIEGDSVELKEYAPTVEGIIQSWAERLV